MAKRVKKGSALKVQKGIAQPPSVSSKFLEKLRNKDKVTNDLKFYVEGIKNKDIKVLAQAITLVESANIEHRKLAQDILEICIPLSGKSVRIGITGVPGVGKSTFIEAIGQHLTALGHKVAVLAIDPSSSRNKGSILGDKTRMESLANDKNAFIRPSPSSGSLGGVAQKTRETISLCEAAGFDIILVETVGVGQSETAVHSMVDFFLLLMLAGAGDELQGIKRGIIEMCDAIFINKADGDNLNKAKSSRVQYSNALHLYPVPDSGWSPTAGICSAITNFNIDVVWDTIEQYMKHTKSNNYFLENRKRQDLVRLHEQIDMKLKARFYNNTEMKKAIADAEAKISNNTASAYKLADELLDNY